MDVEKAWESAKDDFGSDAGLAAAKSDLKKAAIAMAFKRSAPADKAAAEAMRAGTVIKYEKMTREHLNVWHKATGEFNKAAGAFIKDVSAKAKGAQDKDAIAAAAKFKADLGKMMSEVQRLQFLVTMNVEKKEQNDRDAETLGKKSKDIIKSAKAAMASVSGSPNAATWNEKSAEAGELMFKLTKGVKKLPDEQRKGLGAVGQKALAALPYFQAVAEGKHALKVDEATVQKAEQRAKAAEAALDKAQDAEGNDKDVAAAEKELQEAKKKHKTAEDGLAKTLKEAKKKVRDAEADGKGTDEALNTKAANDLKKLKRDADTFEDSLEETRETNKNELEKLEEALEKAKAAVAEAIKLATREQKEAQRNVEKVKGSGEAGEKKEVEALVSEFNSYVKDLEKLPELLKD